jgi:hypothetical protein
MPPGELVRRYWVAGVFLLVGGCFTGWIAVVNESWAAVAFGGAFTGIFVGMAIAAVQRREAARTARRRPSRKR